jgi:hypothetical protein
MSPESVKDACRIDALWDSSEFRSWLLVVVVMVVVDEPHCVGTCGKVYFPAHDTVG